MDTVGFEGRLGCRSLEVIIHSCSFWGGSQTYSYRTLEKKQILKILIIVAVVVAVVVYLLLWELVPIIRSTPLSRTNKLDLKYPPPTPSVRLSTKSFFNFNEIWYVGRGR